jgi:hypothetical protein
MEADIHTIHGTAELATGNREDRDRTIVFFAVTARSRMLWIHKILKPKSLVLAAEKKIKDWIRITKI